MKSDIHGKYCISFTEKLIKHDLTTTTPEQDSEISIGGSMKTLAQYPVAAKRKLNSVAHPAIKHAIGFSALHVAAIITNAIIRKGSKKCNKVTVCKEWLLYKQYCIGQNVPIQKRGG